MVAATRALRSADPWRKLGWIIPLAIVVLAAIVLGSMGLRQLTGVQDFLKTYPGSSKLPVGTPVGFPAWLAWQHALMVFFLLFIVRTGWVVRQGKRPPAMWMRRNTGLLRTKNPPARIGLHLWLHFSFDVLWVLNGVVFVVLIFVTGQWARIVPTSWDVIPNAISAALQYASLNWPVENGWVNYNALQLLAYFITVFIAAPLAVLTGLRLSPGLAARFRRIDRRFTLQGARAIHVSVMVYFIAFTIVHVTLVFATGALRNLNHMYGGSDELNWVGFAIFALSVIVMVLAWFALRPPLVRAVAGTMGSISR